MEIARAQRYVRCLQGVIAVEDCTSISGKELSCKC